MSDLNFNGVQSILKLYCRSVMKPIYKHLYADKANARFALETPLLPKENTKVLYQMEKLHGLIIGLSPIDQRPAYVETQSQRYHWDGKMIICKGNRKVS